MNIKFIMLCINILYFMYIFKYIFWLGILYKLLFNAIFVFQNYFLKLFELFTNFKEKSSEFMFYQEKRSVASKSSIVLLKFIIFSILFISINASFYWYIIFTESYPQPRGLDFAPAKASAALDARQGVCRLRKKLCKNHKKIHQ